MIPYLISLYFLLFQGVYSLLDHKLANLFIQSSNSKLFQNRTVKELLWGYKDPMLNTMLGVFYPVRMTTLDGIHLLIKDLYWLIKYIVYTEKLQLDKIYCVVSMQNHLQIWTWPRPISLYMYVRIPKIRMSYVMIKDTWKSQKTPIWTSFNSEGF